MQGVSGNQPELGDAFAVCGHLVSEGSVQRFLAEHRGDLFPDGMFEDLFRSERGRPSVPGDVIASVLVLQSLEGLSDRDALSRLKTDIAWKAAAGLSLMDEGFHPTVLTLWRNRLRKSQAPERIFDAVRDVVAQTGVLAGKTRRALDSTLLDDAVATQDTVTQLIAAIRRVRRLVPAAAAVSVTAHDYEAGGKPVIAWDDPAAKDALVTALVKDALAILDALDRVELSSEAGDAAGLLALVAGQDVEAGDTEGSWRIARKVVPDRVISTVDPQTRHMHKSRSEYRDGYKAHVAVEPETGIITATDLTPANAADGPTGVALLDTETDRLQVLADSAYGGGETRAALRERGHEQAIKPIPLQSAVKGGYTRDDFVVDDEAGTVTCPAAHTVKITRTNAAVFGRRCRDCPLRERCTTSRKGRKLQLNVHDDELVAARRAWQAQTFLDDYRRWRPMIERAIAWLVADNHRRVRYRGVDRNRLGLSLRAAAVNLRRLINLGLDHDRNWTLANP